MRVLAVFPSRMNPEGIAALVASQVECEATGVGSPEEDPSALAEADAMLVALVPVTADHLAKAERLRFIQTPSLGFDHVDVEAAAARGIPVANVGTSAEEAATVAEHALLLALACARRLVEGHAALREGRWPSQELLAAGLVELRRKTIGIVGFGRIGVEVARRARAFEMEVLYTDVVPNPGGEEATGARRVPLDELLRSSDVVTVHVPLTASTRGLIGERELGLMRYGTILVNTSRGAVVDAHALAAACRSGRVVAGVDVFDPEPPPPDHPLVGAPNVVLSPHVGGVTRESVQRIMAAALENLRRFARGERPLDVVNGL